MFVETHCEQILGQDKRSGFHSGISRMYLEINYTQIYLAFNSYVSDSLAFGPQELLIRVRSIAEIFFAHRDFPRAYIQKRYRRRARTASERIRLIIRDRGCLVNYSADE